MTLKISNQISQRKDLGGDLAAGVESVLDEIAAGYGAYLAPALAEGEQPVDSRQQLVLLRRKILGHVDDLDEADGGVVEKVHGTDKVRTEIDDLASAVVSKMRSVRHTTRGAFGADGVARTGLKGKVSTRPLKVYERARLVQSSLQNPDLGLKPALKVVGNGGPVVEAEGTGLRPADLAAELEPEVTQLGQRLTAQYAEKRGDVDARYRRKNGIKTFDRNIRAIVRILQGTLVLAGREDLAKRFTAKLPRFIRRPSQTEEPLQPADPSPPSTGTEPATEPTPAP
jgi:hypothetical protein